MGEIGGLWIGDVECSFRGMSGGKVGSDGFGSAVIGALHEGGGCEDMARLRLP